MTTTSLSTLGTGTANAPAPSPIPLTAPGETPEAQAPEPASVLVQLDPFAAQAGPDAAIETAAGMVRVHAVFQLDPLTRELTVSVVDEAGRLVRMIPPESVARMIAAMAAYRGR